MGPQLVFFSSGFPPDDSRFISLQDQTRVISGVHSVSTFLISLTLTNRTILSYTQGKVILMDPTLV